MHQYLLNFRASMPPFDTHDPNHNSLVESSGEALGIHTAISLDIQDGEVVYGALRFGYVMDHGEIFGIVDAKIATTRAELLGMSADIWVKDVRGREYRFYGAAIAAAPWYSFYPCCVSYQTLYRFHYADQVGYCSVADIFGLNILAERMSRHGARSGVAR